MSIEKFFIESVGYANTPDEFSVRCYRETPSTPLFFHDVGLGGESSHNHSVCTVSYDTVTKKVVEMSNSREGVLRKNVIVCYAKRPKLKYIGVGDEIPDLE